MTRKTLEDYQLMNKRILIRVDLNVPLDNGTISDTSRIERLVPTIRKIIQDGGKPILMSHFGRLKGSRNETLSLKTLLPPLQKFLGVPVKFSKTITGPEVLEKVEKLANGEVLLLENTRFDPKEEANDLNFSKSVWKRTF